MDATHLRWLAQTRIAEPPALSAGISDRRAEHPRDPPFVQAETTRLAVRGNGLHQTASGPGESETWPGGEHMRRLPPDRGGGTDLGVPPGRRPGEEKT